MITPLVTYAADGRVGIVSLNRPDKLNAISPDLKTMLVERFHEADRDPATSVVILRAEGRSFCAGYDISPNPARASRRGNALAWHESLTDDVQLEMTPWEMKKPVIASVQGHCLGGGCELVMMCDLTIAADDALFGEPEIRFSNVGPALVMPFIIGPKRAINRGAESAGFRNAINAGLDILAALYAARTEVGIKFDEIREKEGLGAALRWRAAQFAE